MAECGLTTWQILTLMKLLAEWVGTLDQVEIRIGKVFFNGILNFFE